MAKRPLTDDEITLAKSIFKNSIDYSHVKIHDRPHNPFQGKNVSMAPNGHIYCHKTYQADFSTGSVHSQAHFIHEMTHIWQYQNRVIHPILGAAKDMIKHRFNYMAAYKYTIDPSKDLTDYGLEQQAVIIQDYFIFKNAQASNSQPHSNLSHGACSDQNHSHYTKVLGKFLANPSYARKAPMIKRLFWFKK
jgi:type VI secretion system secreted protein VgrG